MPVEHTTNSSILPFLYRDPFANLPLISLAERGLGDVWRYGAETTDGVMLIAPEPAGGLGIGIEAVTEAAVTALLEGLPGGETYRFGLHRDWMAGLLEATCRVEHEGVMGVFRCRRGELREHAGARLLTSEDDRAVRRCRDALFLRNFRQATRGRKSGDDLRIQAFGVVEERYVVARCLTTWGDLGIDRLVGTVWSVSTDPPARGRGLGRAVVSAATASILASGRSARYCAYEENAVSQRLCLALGYRRDHSINYFAGARR